MLENIKVILATVFGAFLGIIASEKLPSMVIEFLLKYDIMPFILIFAIGLLTLDNEDITLRNITILFVVSLLLAIIMYFSYDYLHEKMLNIFKQMGIADKPAYNPENMVSLKLQRALNKLPWFTPERPDFLKLN